MADKNFVVDSIVRGYHVYKDVWGAAAGEALQCFRESGSQHDPNTVAVQPQRDNTVTVGHLPRKISTMCLLRGGRIDCIVTEGKQYYCDLPQGGMEISCQLQFIGSPKQINKLQKLMHGLPIQSAANVNRTLTMNPTEDDIIGRKQTLVVTVSDSPISDSDTSDHESPTQVC